MALLLCTADVSKALKIPLTKLLPALAQQHAKSFTLADIEGEDEKVIVCPAAAVDVRHFVHSHSWRVMEVDHGKLKARPAGEGAPPAPEIPEGLRDLRTALDERVRSYAGSVFAGQSGAQGAAGVFVRGEELMLVLAGERRDTENFLASRWASRWAFSPGTGQLRGRVEVHSHYFENGNLQAKFDRKFEDVSLAGIGAAATDPA